MPEKELNYVTSREQASSTDKQGGVYIDAFDAQEQKAPLGRWDRFVDSFRRFDEVELGLDPNLSEVEKAAIVTANSPLSRSLKGRHLQMIAIGGSIGAGLFIGSGQVLKNGGPASVLIAYSLIGGMIFATVHALGELAITFPVSGAFVTYNTRFIDPSWGFAMAWNYAMQWLVVMPLELVAAAITIQYWDDQTNPAAYVAIFYVLIVTINFFGVKGYGEAEFVFSMIKVIAVIGFIILGIVLVCGGGPVGGYIGGRYWHNPGAFNNGFKGLCSVFATAAFAFAGTELVGLAAAESVNPRKSMPKAIKQVFWRICLFYIVSLILVGCLVPYDSPDLQGSDGTAKFSPFVIAINNAGISGLPSVMNVVIMIAVLSVGNSSVFGSSRTLAALAAAGQAPKIFNYIDKKGRPLFGIILQSLFGLISFISASGKQGEVFNWLLALSGMSSLFTWGSICVCHLRFRMALAHQGRGKDELVFVSQAGIIGSCYGVLLNFLIIVAQFWIALWPIGGSPDASSFFQSYLSVPVVMAFYIGHKLWKRNWKFYIKIKDIDIDTGRRDLDLELLKQELAEERAILASKPWYVRIYNTMC
ncbi:amino acid permease [Metschnikowia bicuspidata var. bicuspidata NRRL YB-4993]|uniref:Amino acid permease n=1 Tax=Metschnikowia bicuspidata var. bicuspidata NRRL YB-4993 TaxID=869754 RepID=A0A1A0H881_9ASCO|nr:amino acid permease [Metschnikowia bicuspidata var. bicuspidata NRRL YB-4993]OBA20231.1 amino acid permease [Metschnikowia bicuspidata var. bicuspidata NRRL YB-4993]